jgi:hypothetical protein
MGMPPFNMLTSHIHNEIAGYLGGFHNSMYGYRQQCVESYLMCQPLSGCPHTLSSTHQDLQSSLLLTLIMVRFAIFLMLSTLYIMSSAFPTDSNDYSEYVPRAHRLVLAIHLFSATYHSDGGKCYKEGEMGCVGDDFVTCDHGYFIIRRCGKGTACRRFVSNGIFPMWICARLTMCRQGRVGFV